MNARITSLVAVLAGALLAPSAWAASDATDREALRRQLDEARAELDRARERVTELSRELGEGRRFHIQTFSSKRPMLGFVLGVNEAKGVRLEAVTPDGPADRAGLRSGDVLTRIDGQALVGEHAAERIGEAQRMLGGLEAGQTVVLDYERDGKAIKATVKAEPLAPLAFLGGAMPELNMDRLNIDIDVEGIEEDIERSMGEFGKRIQLIGPMLEESIRFDAWRWQGLRLAPLDEDLARYFGTTRGALVLKAEGDVLNGLRSGDVIQSIDGEAINDPKQAMRTLAEADPGQRVALTVLRERRSIDVALTAPERPDVLRLFAPPAPPPPPKAPAPPPAPAPPVGTATLI